MQHARVETAAGLAVVDFTADWCPPCRQLRAPIQAARRPADPLA